MTSISGVLGTLCLMSNHCPACYREISKAELDALNGRRWNHNRDCAGITPPLDDKDDLVERVAELESLLVQVRAGLSVIADGANDYKDEALDLIKLIEQAKRQG